MAPGWQFAEVDPYDLVKKRNRQRMYLGRYGRQDYFAWDDKEISELDRASEALTELLEQENAFARMEEERG